MIDQPYDVRVRKTLRGVDFVAKSLTALGVQHSFESKLAWQLLGDINGSEYMALATLAQSAASLPAATIKRSLRHAEPAYTADRELLQVIFSLSLSFMDTLSTMKLTRWGRISFAATQLMLFEISKNVAAADLVRRQGLLAHTLLAPPKEAGGTPAVPGLRSGRRFRGLLRSLA
jgi:hypothetical protein